MSELISNAFLGSNLHPNMQQELGGDRNEGVRCR